MVLRVVRNIFSGILVAIIVLYTISYNLGLYADAIEWWKWVVNWFV